MGKPAAATKGSPPSRLQGTIPARDRSPILPSPPGEACLAPYARRAATRPAPQSRRDLVPLLPPNSIRGRRCAMSSGTRKCAGLRIEPSALPHFRTSALLFRTPVLPYSRTLSYSGGDAHAVPALLLGLVQRRVRLGDQLVHGLGGEVRPAGHAR